MLSPLLVFALATSPLPRPLADCGPLPGIEAVLAAPDLNYLLIGEYHGTVEMPAVAADAMCAAATAGRPVILGVELPPANQAFLDAYLASDGGQAARTALLRAPAWQVREGRTTVAMLDLVESARRLARAGLAVSIAAFDRVPEPVLSKEREAAMAEALIDARARVAGSLVVALTGAGHAGKTPWTSQDPPFPSTGGLLPDRETIALAFRRPGGQYWGCHAPNGDATGGCRAYDMPPREPLVPRGIVLDRTVREGFEGVYSAGRTYTASPPARSPSP